MQIVGVHKLKPLHNKHKRKYCSKSVVTGVRGKWSDQQNIIYFKFLIDHRKDFQKPGQRKRNQVFLRMSKLLGSRTPQQCRSHHQKVENYAETKQISGLCQFLLEKLSYSTQYKYLHDLYREYRQNQQESVCTYQYEEVRQSNYRIYGNDRGSFNLTIDIQSIGTW